MFVTYLQRGLWQRGAGYILIECRNTQQIRLVYFEQEVSMEARSKMEAITIKRAITIVLTDEETRLLDRRVEA